MGGMYLLLFGLVRRGSQTIVTRSGSFTTAWPSCPTLLERNAQLDAKVRGAAARTTALNERFLRRIATDLHDGPGQDLGFALMRFEAIDSRYEQCDRGPRRRRHAAGRLPGGSFRARIRARRPAVDLGGLAAAGNHDLSINEIAGRAVRDYERKTGVKVALVTADDPSRPPFPSRSRSIDCCRNPWPTDFGTPAVSINASRCPMAADN